MAKLEEELKTTLFIRGRRGVVLTHTGEVLLRHARHTLRTLDVARPEIEGLESEPRGQAVALAVFVAAGTLGILVPIGVYFAFGGRSAAILAALRAWLVRHSTVAVMVLLVLIGAKLISDGIADL